mgnify:CR=1 FL=1
MVALSDAAGDTVQLYEYSVYGQVAASDPNHPNPFLFTGRRFDTDTGLYYYRARYYNPYIGRFLQTDPIGYGDGMNMYAYCGNNSLRWVDPYGAEAGPDFALVASISEWRFLVTVTIGSDTQTINCVESISGAIQTLSNLDSVFTDEWMESQPGWKLSGENERLFWTLQVINKLGGGFNYGDLEDFGVTLDYQPFLDAFPDNLWDEWDTVYTTQGERSVKYTGVMILYGIAKENRLFGTPWTQQLMA